jgi:EAL domain-containing protein (putative c-di-GMP-specific phosphodiesterase class I)
LRDPGFVDAVCSALAKSGIKPHRLELDLTEAEPLYQGVGEGEKLGVLRAAGVRIAIDDFGHGQCCLEKLPELAVDRLKLSARILECRPGTTEIRTPVFAGALIGMAKAMNVDVLAKGVETNEQHALLLAKGCTLAQGFYYATPARPAELSKLLQEQSKGKTP